MNDRGARRSFGAPFYAAPRRKTSAEIISEARAAISAEMSSMANVGGALRPLRTRRPFTPREPQRTLFTENARNKDARPPSAFDLKHLTLTESSEDDFVVAQPGNRDEDSIRREMPAENYSKKIPAVRPLRDAQERSNEGWGRFTKLPHLSGRSKPLHRRNTTEQTVSSTSPDLTQSISVTRPFSNENRSVLSENPINKNDLSKCEKVPLTVGVSPDTSSKRKQFASKSISCEAGTTIGEVFVKQLEVQLPNTFRGNDDYNNMSVLELAEALSQKTRDVDRIIQLLAALQNIIVKTSPANSLRELVLRSLYTHIDCEDERVLVAIARAMLTMDVTGAHLAAACKLVFKIARNDKNDLFFKNSNLLELLVEGCGRVDPLSESECCVYAAGALRFLALEPQLCALAHHAGALPLAALHLKILNNAKAERPRHVSDQATHALYQVTGALRNLASNEGSGRAFAASGVLAELLAALTLHTDRDVLTNVARCLSVLSADDSCCAWLCASPISASALLTALAACASRAPLTVRLAYTLGNMAAADEQARINIYNEEGGIDVLLTVLESYSHRNESDAKDLDSDPDLHLVGSDLGGSDGSNEDVLIKTVRVIANLCLAELAGRGLAATHAERTVRALLSCLQLAEKPVHKASDISEADYNSWVERHEELAMAALATLNNITFFFEPSESSHHNILEQLCKATCRWVRGTGAAACEAVRALGNLSRSARASQLIVLEGALDALPPLQHHEDPSVRCAAAGLLVNVCGAGGAGDAAAAATRALSDAAHTRDVSAAALLARALWNAQAHRPLDPTQAQQATAALAVFIDDDSMFTACEVPKIGDRRASDPQLSRLHHVKFDIDNNNYQHKVKDFCREPNLAVKAYSVEEDLHLEQDDDEGERYSGEDLGFEEGEIEECECAPCKRLAAWEELIGVAIPLLEQLRPPRADASVGTD
ncbi:armadillo repeat-containing protein 2 [Maniola jurtina]|uniref:armadillo repeat-containing protein 2 n=1 Tax=Maniola jurtina TaxID=191418 RepID=UPI001E68D0B3|nr:armadillo repeat-containing protein 2 [Maniola jurtina]XP_045770279.1 armadillo repeat-containing protein 2 [Maniola jurtina]